MRHFKTAFSVCLMMFASSAFGQTADCRSDDYLQAAMAHLESHYRSFPEELFTTQLLLREGFEKEDISPDGKWGPKTQSVICDVLQTYTKIGGSDGDWGIRRASHAPQFSQWVLKAARSNLSDGEVEFPD